jgi:hypothetical protein
MRGSSQTQEFIVEGFWMKGEFTCFLTLDESNKVYIELFGFETDGVYTLADKIFLCDFSSYENLKTVISDNREFISLLFYSNVSLLTSLLTFRRNLTKASKSWA